MSKKGHIPVRMCMGCRKKKRKEEMLRLIKGSEGIYLLNGKRKLDGRGYYLCPDRICLRLAQKKHRGLESLKSDNRFDSTEKGGDLLNKRFIQRRQLNGED